MGEPAAFWLILSLNRTHRRQPAGTVGSGSSTQAQS